MRIESIGFRDHSWRAGCKSVVAAMLILWMVPVSAGAQEDAEPEAQTLREWVYKRIAKAQDLLSKSEHADAVETLDSLRERERRMNTYEVALMYQTYGYIYADSDKPLKAAKAFESALALNALPKTVALDVQYNLGHLYMAAEEYIKASRILANWFSKAKNPSPRAEFMLANAYAQAKNYKKALSHTKRAIARHKKKDPGWYRLQLAMEHELKRMRDMLKTLGTLIVLDPGRKYWIQMAAVYSQLNDEARTLAVYELCYRQGYLTDQRELMNLVQLYIQRGMPHQAAQTLEAEMAKGRVARELKPLKLLAASWWEAREVKKAIVPLTEAAAMSEGGEAFVQLAQLHIENMSWGAAAESVEKALVKGIEKRGNAYLLLGIAYMSAKKNSKARDAFEEALKYPKAKRQARQWLRHLKN